MSFMQSLAAAWKTNDSLLCVGLDPDPAKFPAHLKDKPDAIFRFCSEIADATADLACAFKPQIAYFAARRAEDQLEALIAHIHDKHPGVPVILDAKRGDIGSTAEQYAIEAFERYRADAVTVNPYMGRDSVEPYLAYKDKGVILLCRTSNPGGSDLQFLKARVGAGEGDLSSTSRSWWPANGTPPANARWWSAPPSRRDRTRAPSRRRDAAAGAGHRRPGRRHRGHGQGRAHGAGTGPDDQFLARHPLRRQGRGLCGRRAQGGAGNPRRDQSLALRPPRKRDQSGPIRRFRAVGGIRPPAMAGPDHNLAPARNP
jgi:hypothetical protein